MKTDTPNRVLDMNGRAISYEWIRKQVKNINLRVRSDGTVSVSSPYTVSEKQIEAFLTDHANFLFRALDTFEKQKKSEIAPPTFREGDIITLFGEEKRLRFLPVLGEKIVEKDGFLCVAPTHDEKKMKEKLQKYAQNRLLDHLTDFSEKAMKQFPEVKKSPEIRLRAMRTTWGNCRIKEGILTFNSRLASYPLPCIEYVVMHEFSHFLVPNHSEAFYAVLSQRMPDWKARKAHLNTCQIQPFF